MPQLNFVQNYPFTPQLGALIENASILFFPQMFNGSISLNTANLIINRSNSSFSYSLSLGLYSLNGSTLSLENSGSYSTALGTTNNKIFWVSITTFSKTQNITPGTWFWGIHVSYSNQSRSQIGMFNVTPENAFPGSFIGGQMTETTSALPASAATSNLDITGNTEMFSPYIIIAA